MNRRCTRVIALFVLVWSSVASATCYVNVAAVGANNGSSWANAFTNLQSALTNPGCFEIWVARGTYKPTATTDRTISFNVRPGAVVYGGFDGTEATIGARNLAANPTILSGDIGVAGDSSDNSYHVVVMDGTTANGIINIGTLLSDFTIRLGNASGSGTQSKGGGLFCNGDGATHECSPELDDVIFENNGATDGGAIYDAGTNGGISSPTVHNAIFRNNATTNDAGAIYNDGRQGTASPLIEQAAFSGNSAGFEGGAIANDGSSSGVSSPTIRNTTFYSNTGLYVGGIVNFGQNAGHASPVLRYVTFNKNKATFGPGGAIRNIAFDGDAAPNLSGVIFWGDQAQSAPYEMATQSLTTPTVDYSISPECPAASIGCFNADPLLGPLQDNGGFAPSMLPAPGSAAVDAGNAAKCPAFDQRSVSRPQGPQCDIGAVELQPQEVQRCYVTTATPPVMDGQSWATAYNSIALALAVTTCNEIWVKQGTYATTTGTDRFSSFVMRPGKELYGGFAGTETLRSQRNPATYPTILTGDIGVLNNASDNAYHVVAFDAGTYGDMTSSTALDGLTIQGGNADANTAAGGGVICVGQSGHVCSPALRNLVFKNNTGTSGGALAFLGDSGGTCSPTLTSSTFTGNTATSGGGALIVSAANPVVTDVVFSGNQASFGGAVDNDDSAGGTTSPVFTRVTFAGNSASGAPGGGAVYNNLSSASSAPSFNRVVLSDNTAPSGVGGGAAIAGGSSTFTDATFLRNSAPNSGGAIDIHTATAGVGTTTIDRSAFVANTSALGGGVYCQSQAVNANMTITNSTFALNFASTGAGAILMTGAFSHPANATLRNLTFAMNSSANVGAVSIGASGAMTATISDTIAWGDSVPEIQITAGTVSIDHSIVQSGCPAGATCTAVSTSDPLLGALENYGGYTPAFMPAPNSPALEAGANCTAVDQRGVARPQGALCDIGAIERQTTEETIFNNGFEF